MTFRENEASRVSAVLERKLAGDVRGMVDAASQLWLTMPEREGEPDAAEAEVWAALVEQNAVADALKAGEALIRARQLLRPGGFVRVIENLPAANLLELVPVVLDAGWPAQPYLGAVFAAAIDAKQEDALWAFMKAHGGRLAERIDTWILVGFTLTTSRIGDRGDLAAWFESWEARDGVPMWLIAAHAATICQQYPRLAQVDLRRLIKDARAAREKAIGDASAAFFAAVVMIDLLRNDKYDEFAAEFATHGPALEADVVAPLVEHPLARYANIGRRSRPVVAEDFTYEPPTGSLYNQAVPRAQRPANWRIGMPVRELRKLTARANLVLRLFDEMLRVPPKDPAAVELCRKMSRVRPSEMPWVQDSWKRLVRQRVGWWTRVKLELF